MVCAALSLRYPELDVRREITVSYTHLDVYKRQVREYAAAESPGSAGHRHGNAGVRQFLPGDLSLIHI